MSVLSDIESDYLKETFDSRYGLAEKATYIPVDGDEKEILVVADVGNTRLTDADRENRSYMDALFSIRVSDIPKPISGDVILYQGETYHFLAIHKESMGFYTLRCVRNKTAVTFP